MEATKAFESSFVKNMPQIVPAGLYSPDTYSVYAENFDLSLLPADGEVLLCPQSQLSNNQSPQSNDYIPATIFHDSPIKVEKNNWSNLPFTSNQQFQYNNSLGSQPREPFITVFPPSPTPSIDCTQTQFHIKQEYMDLLPPSPPDSNCAPSPRSDIKSENDFETETCINIDSLLQRSFDAFESKKQDHQLLREYLLDTTFQRKHNLKPLDLDSLIAEWINRGKIEPLFVLALEQFRKDHVQTCAALNISPDPQKWTKAQVQSWLQQTTKQFQLTTVPEMDVLFPEDGAALLRLTDEEFIKRLPQGGGTIHAQLIVWRAALSDTTPWIDNQSSGTTSTAHTAMLWSPIEKCQSAEASDGNYNFVFCIITTETRSKEREIN
ncbi:DNA-binding protein D-ETS-4 [Pseudolycoriella hygida]|uniref:DNA-binding protein D-ETS-4 n=1 Tax=Pseudolycoriella hygida TaxID=35572 RepID=A0A9Q0NES7_9DIPT|nr:DNA-binding protein D-ETS-4 [Pseudolycoriella hygida]